MGYFLGSLVFRRDVVLPKFRFTLLSFKGYKNKTKWGIAIGAILICQV